MSRSVFQWIAIVVAAAMASGCTGRYESEFSVLIVNRTANEIQAMANGNPIGNVAPGQTGSFSLTLPESSGNTFVNGVAPTPQANVTLSAKDTKTGALSSEKSTVLTQGSPTSVAFTTDDFPDTGPTIARFTFSPTSPTINQDVSFNASSSSASNGIYGWDFGDGQTGAGVTVTHRYQRGGTFTITLTVTSDTRATSSSSRTVTVSTTLAATTANFTFSPTNPAINQDVVFTATSSAGGGTPFPPFPGGGNPPGGGTPPGGGAPPGGGNPAPGANDASLYLWDFGDGTSAIGTTATHRYTRGGTYTSRLTVTTTAGLSATTTRQVTVSTTLPAGSASFVFSPTDPRTGDTVYFNASSSTAVSATYAWDFGDGHSGSGVAPTHSYSEERTYTVSLIVTNNLGQTASASKTITVATPD